MALSVTDRQPQHGLYCGHELHRSVRDLLHFPPERVNPTISLRSLTSVLISRFMLNLQAASRGSAQSSSTIGSQIDTVVFERIVGSIGAFINTEPTSGNAEVEDEGKLSNSTRHRFDSESTIRHEHDGDSSSVVAGASRSEHDGRCQHEGGSSTETGSVSRISSV